MKATRIIGKLITSGIFVCCLLLFTVHSFAIENLQISVIQTNAALTWGSTNDGSETFLVQYRGTLSPTDSWTTLADYLPASSSNSTTFVDVTNIIQYPTNSGDVYTNSGGGGGIPMPTPGDTNIYSGSMDTNIMPVATGFYRVVRDGAYMYVGNTNWSGTMNIPVEMGNASGTVPLMSLIENNDMVGNSVQNPSTTLTVDTTQMSNGVHQVQLSTSWNDTNGNLITQAYSTPTTVNVYNEISYPDWMASYGELGNSCLFNIVSAHTNATWQLDIYSSDYNYIGSFTGTTTDGNITALWNLVDGDGVTHTNDTFFICVITTGFDTTSGTSSIAKGGITVRPNGTAQAQTITPPTYKVTDPWSGSGKFAMAVQHAFDFITDSSTLYEELNGFAGAANGAYGVSPPLSSGEPYPINYQNPYETGDWAAFKSALYNPSVRNLVYFGHGGILGLGANSKNTNNAILIPEINAMLHNIPAGQTNAHRFRFCFVDGCSTAAGKMPEAFGIIHKENVSGLDYYNASLRPSTYCGWTDDKSIGYVSGAALNYGHVNFILHIQTFMLANGYSISSAISAAAAAADVTITFNTTSDFKVYGFADQTFGSNND